jgi:hypothetical protein
MRCDEKDRLLDEYAARAREFCEAVDHLRKTSNDVEAFIHALDELLLCCCLDGIQFFTRFGPFALRGKFPRPAEMVLDRFL